MIDEIDEIMVLIALIVGVAISLYLFFDWVFWRFIWPLLPDKCYYRNKGCCRLGVRGNENLALNKATHRVIAVCDYCDHEKSHELDVPPVHSSDVL